MSSKTLNIMVWLHVMNKTEKVKNNEIISDPISAMKTMKLSTVVQSEISSVSVVTHNFLRRQNLKWNPNKKDKAIQTSGERTF